MAHWFRWCFLVAVLAVAAGPPAIANEGLEAYHRGDYVTAYREWIGAAEQGDAFAQYHLGVLYNDGDGVNQNYEASAYWYRRAADQGFVNAQYNLGVLYRDGQGVVRDYGEAIHWFLEASNQGDASAQFNLGALYGNGEGVPLNYVEAVRWYRLAAEQGFPEAEHELGWSYHQGIGVEQDYETALDWYYKAAIQGLAKSQYNLGVFAGESQDNENAARWYRLAAEQNLPEAQYNLGVLYHNGTGVEQNYEEAAYWYFKSSDQGMASAQNNLGVLYLSGQGVEKDYEEAARLYRKSAIQGYVVAENNLGDLYQHGIGVAKNYEEAVKWYRRAADKGLDKSQNNLGIIYYRGTGKVSRDYVEAYKWFSLSAAQSNRSARVRLDSLEKELTPSQIAEGKKRALEWQPSEDVANLGSSDGIFFLPGEIDYNLVATGSGFIVNRDGYVLTNHHVVDGCSKIKISPSSSAVRVVAYSEEDDLALLSYTPDPSLMPVRWRGGLGVRLGEDVVIAGYPLQGILTSDLGVTTGTISALSGLGGDRRHFQITAPVQPGNSGGPLLDSAGRASGVVVAELDEIAMIEWAGDIPQNVNFAIRSDVARDFMDAYNVEYIISPDDNVLSPADIAEEARLHTVRIECG